MHSQQTIAGPNVLRKVLDGPHKINRNTAIKRAEHNIDGLRQEFTLGLTREIFKFESLANADAGHLSEIALQEIIILSTVIYNLAGALGHPCLQETAASLYDLLVVMSDKGLRCVDPVLVHASVARLLAPGMPPVSEGEAQKLLGQLKEIVAHFRDKLDPCNRAACSACPAKAI